MFEKNEVLRSLIALYGENSEIRTFIRNNKDDGLIFDFSDKQVKKNVENICDFVVDICVVNDETKFIKELFSLRGGIVDKSIAKMGIINNYASFYHGKIDKVLEYMTNSEGYILYDYLFNRNCAGMHYLINDIEYKDVSLISFAHFFTALAIETIAQCNSIKPISIFVDAPKNDVYWKTLGFKPVIEEDIGFMYLKETDFDTVRKNIF